MSQDTADKHQKMPDLFQSLATQWNKHIRTESEAGRVLWDNLKEATMSTGVGHSREWGAMEGYRAGQGNLQHELLVQSPFLVSFSPHLVSSFSLGSFSHEWETEGLTMASTSPLASSLALSLSNHRTPSCFCCLEADCESNMRVQLSGRETSPEGAGPAAEESER